MAVRYVRKSGSDANGGTSPSDAWLTIGKALGASGISSGDTLYIGAGVYRETVTVAMTSATVETKIIGDVDGSQTGDAGTVRWTAYTTSDTAAAAGASLVSLAGRDFFTFQNLTLCNGVGNAIDATTTDSTNITVRDCVFIGYTGVGSTRRPVYAAASFGTTLNWLIDRCVFAYPAGSSACVGVDGNLGTGADYSVGVVIQNSLFAYGTGFGVQLGVLGTGANKPGGVTIRNCSFFGGAPALSEGANPSATVASTVTNCLIVTPGATALTAGVTGQITEDYNQILCATTPRNNVTAGTHSISDASYAQLFQYGQDRIVGGPLRHFFEPAAGSPALGYGDDGNAPTVDLRNNPRPAGGTSALKALGALERANTWARETTTVYSGANALSITGPGYQDFQLAVGPTPTTIGCYMAYDSTYAGTKPQLKILNGTEAGVADATATLGAVGALTFSQLTLSFTPTGNGIVTVRLQSNDTNGAGKAYADQFSVA